MATLPDVESIPRGGLQSAQGIAAYQPEDWRHIGVAGQEISSAGNDLSQAADTIAQTNERQDAIVAQSAANSLRQASVTLQYDPNQGFASVKEGGTVGQQFVDDYAERFSNAQAEIRAKLTSPAQQRLFDQHAQVASMQFKQAVLEHQAVQTDRFNDTTANDTVTLALRSMAARPLDDLNFSTGMAQIYATIDAAGKRRGLPDATVQTLKDQSFDAAYNTRISSVLNGIPGVVQSNPYLAEKMFQQVQDQLGPQSQVALAQQVQKGVQQVQQRDLADQILAGRLPITPDVLAPITQGTAPMAAIVEHMESGGDTSAVSPKGAQGAMQVMPATSTNPGFGVRPAQLGADGKPLPGELERVGRDYLGAMTARYQNPALILAAYNAGPGQVDKWIVQNGDPRIGQISTADWAAKIPFDETNKYVASGLQQLGAAQAAAVTDAQAQTNPAQYAGTTGADGALPPVGATAQPQAPTASELKTRLPGMMAEARDSWLTMYPNDPVGADVAATRVASKGQLVIFAQTAQQDAARDTIMRSLMGPAPDGSQRATTMDQLLADPQTKAAWNSATPEVQLAVSDRIRQGDRRLDADSIRTYYELVGEAGTDPSSFAKVDLGAYFGKLPDNLLLGLMTQQKSAQQKDIGIQDKQMNFAHAMELAKDYVLGPAGIRIPTKDTDKGSPVAKNYAAFAGQLDQAIDLFQVTNKRLPKDQEIVAMAQGLTTTVHSPGWLLGNIWRNDMPAFNVTPDIVGSVTVDVPTDFRQGIVQAIKDKGGSPTEAQIQTAWLIHLNPNLSGRTQYQGGAFAPPLAKELAAKSLPPEWPNPFPDPSFVP